MSLPTAVKRNADKARQMVAESRGAPASTPTPQASDGEYLNVESVTPNQTQGAATVSPVSAKALADQQAKLDSDRHVKQRDEGTYVPHALSHDAPTNTGTQETSYAEQIVAEALSPRDTANGNPGDALPDFINEDDWRSRYTALRIARDERAVSLEQENRRIKAELDNTRKQAPKQAEENPATKRFELSDEARLNLGEDQSLAFDQLSKSVEDRFSQQENEQRKKDDREIEGFESNLGSMVPRWRTINVDPNFLNWLSQVDEVAGMKRQSMLDAFVRERDATSVAAIFRSFVVGSSGTDQQRIGQTPSPEFDGTRAGAGLGAEESMVEVWDQSEIADFYQAKNRLYQSGKLIGAKLESVLAEEAKIRKAMDEGRVNMSA